MIIFLYTSYSCRFCLDKRLWGKKCLLAWNESEALSFLPLTCKFEMKIWCTVKSGKHKVTAQGLEFLFLCRVNVI